MNDDSTTEDRPKIRVPLESQNPEQQLDSSFVTSQFFNKSYVFIYLKCHFIFIVSHSRSNTKGRSHPQYNYFKGIGLQYISIQSR